MRQQECAALAPVFAVACAFAGIALMLVSGFAAIVCVTVVLWRQSAISRFSPAASDLANASIVRRPGGSTSAIGRNGKFGKPSNTLLNPKTDNPRRFGNRPDGGRRHNPAGAGCAADGGRALNSPANVTEPSFPLSRESRVPQRKSIHYNRNGPKLRGQAG